MKRIEFIAPVEAMRGNLSGAQKLQYPTDDQGAYEGPVGSKNYARNYSPRFVGSKRASDGRKYFSVRTKTANHLTSKSKKAMALMGGTGAIVGYILGHKSAAVYTNLMACWLKAQELGDTQTLRQFASYYVRSMLVSKQASITLHIASASASIDNPWCKIGDDLNVSVSQQVLVKFWDELSFNGYSFYVDSFKGITPNDNTFDEIIAVPSINVLNLDTNTIEGTAYVTRYDSYLLDGSEYVTAADKPTAGKKYTLTTVEPE